jgi:serine phosphatase RsbU (regulator of sigma subunit)
MALLAAACLVIYVGDSELIRYGFPWALISLLVVGAIATLYGTRPAILVLLLSALFGDLIVPDLHISYFYGHGLYAGVRLVRTLLFVACGTSFVWLTRQAKLIQARADRRMLVVEALQRMISPAKPCTVLGYDVSGVYCPARDEEQVGGDFYDVYPITASEYGVLIGDVMGKGKEAAAHTAMLRYSVRSFASMGLSPGETLGRISNLVERQGHDIGTASLFVGVLDVRSHSLHYANAGHEPPLLCRANGVDETLDVTGPIIGATVGYEYADRSVALLPGDVLLLMTDGVTEARNSRGQFLDAEGVRERLRSVLQSRSTGLPRTGIMPRKAAEVALSELLDVVNGYIGPNSRDDIAMLLLRRDLSAGGIVEKAVRVTAVSREASVC